MVLVLIGLLIGLIFAALVALPLSQLPSPLKEVAPFNGPLLVKAGGAQYALGREVASKIWLRKK